MKRGVSSGKLHEKHPNLSHDLKKQCKDNKELPVKLKCEIFYNADEFLRKIRNIIGKIIEPTLNDFVNLLFENESKVDKWIERNGKKLDSSFFAALSMLIDGAIPFYVKVFTTKEGGITTQEDVIEFLKKTAFKLKLHRFFHFSKRILRENKLPYVYELIENTYNPQDIDDDLIKCIGEIIDAKEKQETENSLLKNIELYAQEASLAATFKLSNKENLRRKIWAARYFGYEFLGRSSKFPREPVSVEFAKSTIKYTDIADQFLAFLNPENALIQSEKDIMIVSEIIEDLGYAEILSKCIPNALEINIKDKEKFDEFFDSFCEILEERSKGKPELKATITLNLLKILLDNHKLKKAITLADKNQKTLLDSGNISDATWLACRTSELLNQRQLSKPAFAQLMRFQKLLEAKSLWPIEDVDQKIGFLTEKANCLRYLGNQEEAISLYEEIRSYFNDDYEKTNFRINERNLSIVLREMGNINESISILENMIGYAEGDEKIDTLNSLGASYIAAGDYYKATELFLKAYSEVEKGPLHYRLRLRVLINLMSGASQIDEFELSEQAAAEALEIAEEIDDIINIALISGFYIYHSKILRNDEVEEDVMNHVLLLLNSLIDSTDGLYIPKNIELITYMILSALLLKTGKLVEAEKVLHRALKKFKEYYHADMWKLWSMLSSVYAKTREFSQAIRCSKQAYNCVIEAILRHSPRLEQFHIMLDKDVLHYDTAKILTEAYINDEIDGLTLLNGIDIQNSLMLSVQQLQNRTLPSSFKSEILPLDQTIIEDALAIMEDHLKKVLIPFPYKERKSLVVLLHTIELEGTYRILLTWFMKGKITHNLLDWEISKKNVMDLANKANFVLSMWNPHKSENPFDKIKGWKEFSDRLLFELERLFPEDSHICIIPSGFMGDLPLHAILLPYFSCSYSPNVHFLIQQRTNRLAIENGVRWRPKSVFSFVAWKHEDTIIESLKSSAKTLENECKAINVDFEKAIGIDATPNRLKSALEKYDLLNICCHGIFEPKKGHFFLLVANNRQLPPSDPKALESEDAKKFLFTWRDIHGISRCAPIIFSTACASSSTISTRGNERIGFERSFLGYGGLSYIAPFWKIPAKEINEFLNMVVINYLHNTNQTLAETLLNETRNFLRNGTPEWIAKSITIQGDWL